MISVAKHDLIDCIIVILCRYTLFYIIVAKDKSLDLINYINFFLFFDVLQKGNRIIKPIGIVIQEHKPVKKL